MTVSLSPAALDLFLGFAEDASNWSGSPLISVNAEGKGHLTHLKKVGLVQSFEDEGCSFIVFTRAGLALAAEHGHDLAWIEEYGLGVAD